jgi:hypothetical protein
VGKWIILARRNHYGLHLRMGMRNRSCQGDARETEPQSWQCRLCVLVGFAASNRLDNLGNSSFSTLERLSLIAGSHDQSPSDRELFTDAQSGG